MLALYWFSKRTLLDGIIGGMFGNIFGKYSALHCEIHYNLNMCYTHFNEYIIAFYILSVISALFIPQGNFEMMGSGIYSQNGILTYMATNFYLVGDAWSRVAGAVATSFAILILSVMLPYSNSMEPNSNDSANNETPYGTERLTVIGIVLIIIYQCSVKN